MTTKHTPTLWVNVFQAHNGAFIQKFTAHEGEERGQTTIWPDLALTYDSREQALKAIENDGFYRGFNPMILSDVLENNRAALALAEGE